MYTFLLLLVTLLVQYVIARRLFVKYIYGVNFLRTLRQRINLVFERQGNSARPLLTNAETISFSMPNSGVNLKGQALNSNADAARLARNLDGENIIALAAISIFDAKNTAPFSVHFSVQAKVQRCACYRRVCKFFLLNPDCAFCD